MTNRPPETNVNLFLPDWTFGIAMGKSEAPTVVSLFHLVKINANAQKTPPHTRIWEGNVARVPKEPFLAGCSNRQARLNKGSWPRWVALDGSSPTSELPRPPQPLATSLFSLSGTVD